MNLKKMIRQILKKNNLFLDVYYITKNYYYKYLISDEKLIKKKFKKRLNREVNLNNPKKYNDKLQWLKLYWDDPLAEAAADKYKVRELVTNRVGSQYLNKLLGVYESVDEIDLDVLPNKFVLKGTHGSGFNIICEDKTAIDWKFEFRKMRRWFKLNYFWQNRESVYKNIKPRIICEKYLEQDSDEELKDYRFFCFNGEPKFIAVDFSINDKEKTRRNLYDLNWNLMDPEITYPKELKKIVEKPKKLEEMIEISRKLSSDFPHARVDFYYINNKIFFGEITFFHQSGMGNIIPEEFEVTMGSWLELPKIHN